MKFPIRALLATLLVAGGAFACADSASPTRTRFSPHDADVSFAKIKATDSLMMVTDVSYSDTSLVLKRLVPLDADITASATIGPTGGSIVIQQAGAKIDIPPGALSAPTLITMTAFKGYDVAYDFQPHGTLFTHPVKVQQTIKGTWGEKYPELLKGMHGSYYGQESLDSAWVDPLKFFAKIQENQIGYLESNASQIKFYVDHFSGYMVSCGFTGR
jgi:hypothetical protein